MPNLRIVFFGLLTALLTIGCESDSDLDDKIERAHRTGPASDDATDSNDDRPGLAGSKRKKAAEEEDD